MEIRDHHDIDQQDDEGDEEIEGIKSILSPIEIEISGGAETKEDGQKEGQNPKEREPRTGPFLDLGVFLFLAQGILEFGFFR